MNSVIIDDFKNLKKKELMRNDFNASEKHIKFNSRSPIFKALMKLEFEKAIREYVKNQ